MMRATTENDKETIKSWYMGHGQEYMEELYPFEGLIIPGLAAGFLLRTIGEICFLDGFITNPEAPKRARAQAMRDITKELLKRCASVKCVIALTKVKSVQRLAAEHGFAELEGFTVMGRIN